jgi:hypothetical protein
MPPRLKKTLEQIREHDRILATALSRRLRRPEHRWIAGSVLQLLEKSKDARSVANGLAEKTFSLRLVGKMLPVLHTIADEGQEPQDLLSVIKLGMTKKPWGQEPVFDEEIVGRLLPLFRKAAPHRRVSSIAEDIRSQAPHFNNLQMTLEFLPILEESVTHKHWPFRVLLDGMNEQLVRVLHPLLLREARQGRDPGNLIDRLNKVWKVQKQKPGYDETVFPRFKLFLEHVTEESVKDEELSTARLLENALLAEKAGVPPEDVVRLQKRLIREGIPHTHVMIKRLFKAGKKGR